MASAASATTSTSVKSAVELPVHAEPSRSGVLTLSSIEPVGCTHRLRTPVDVPSQTVLSVVGGEAVVALRAVEDLGQALDQPAEHPDRRLAGPVEPRRVVGAGLRERRDVAGRAGVAGGAAGGGDQVVDRRGVTAAARRS